MATMTVDNDTSTAPAAGDSTTPALYSTLNVPDMKCGGCGGAVESTLSTLDLVKRADVSLDSTTVTVDLADGGSVDAERGDRRRRLQRVAARLSEPAGHRCPTGKSQRSCRKASAELSQHANTPSTRETSGAAAT